MRNPFFRVSAAWLAHPAELARAWQEVATVAWASMAPVHLADAAEGDDRFADPAWHGNSFFHSLMQNYLAVSRTVERLVYDTPGVDDADSRSAAFWLRHWCNAVSPSNFLWTNPVALRRAFDTGGESLRQGFSEWLHDLVAGDVRMVDSAPFELGRNVAATPGKVVLRNELMELIHYTPVRAQVHAIPLLFVPPWINKFYILDLTEQQSMVRYLVHEGFDVFIVSWRNPPPAMAHVTFEDHLFEGIMPAIDAARAISGAGQVHAVGYCIGGTALAALMGWLNAARPEPMPVAHWTLLATLADFAKPGDIASFICEDSVAMLDSVMARQGCLSAQQVGWSFRLLRPNTQVWRYVVHKYLLGEPAAALAPLAWNADGTRLPRATQSFCLHELYLANKLAHKGELVLRGEAIDLGAIRQPAYVVGAVVDHITPWRSTYASAALLGGQVRYTLASSGHILGIINPPGVSEKSHYWRGELTPGRDARTWQSAQEQVAGSWWTDWSLWLAQQCGHLRPAVTTAHPAYPWLCDAPGVYVREH